MTTSTTQKAAHSLSDPYTSLSFHFGMLLGVDDFEVLAGYARAKGWMHQAWLHGAGVVWGLDVAIDGDSEEVRVEPGLGIDGLGREVPVDEAMCASLPRWFAEHRDDPALELTDNGDGTFGFVTWVLAEAQACLTRPVPAVSDGCDHEGIGSAYSRAVETAKLTLATLPPAPPPDAFPRTRLWLDLRAPDRGEDGVIVDADQAILDARAAAGADVAARRAGLQSALRADVTARRPAPDDRGGLRRAPVAPPAPLVLARVEATVRADGDAYRLVEGAPPEVDRDVRSVLVPTTALQGLLLDRAAAAGAAPGPQIEAMEVQDEELRFAVTADLFASSVRPEAFAVRRFEDAAGWQTIDVAEAGLEGGDPRKILVRLAEAPGPGQRLRVLARGEGLEPILGADGLPLAGAAGTAAAGDEGRDYVRGLVVE